MSIVMTAVAPTRSLTRGHKKKSRTRQQLLDAALDVLSERGELFAISEVAARAGVSHGTFYNYFTDRDELFDSLVAYVVESFAAVAAREIDETDPAARFARISARALASAVEAPNTVRVMLRLEAAQRALLTDGPLAYLQQDLVDGHRLGRFTEVPDDATLDVIIGALLLAARRVLDGDVEPSYHATVIRRLLMSLGVDGDEAARLASRAVAQA